MRLSGQEIGYGRGRALVRNIGDIDASPYLEQRAQEVRRCAEASAVVELARIGFGVCDELLHVFCWDGRCHDKNVWQQRNSCDRNEQLERLNIELRIERGRDSERAG